MESLERRLEILEARAAIGELVAAYCSAVDAGDPLSLSALFTTDAVFGELRGRKAIAEFFADWMREWGPSFHHPHAHTIAFASPDEAAGELTGHAEQKRGAEVWIMGLRYHDGYRRVGGAWLFASRRVDYVYRLPAAEYGTRFGEVRR